ncbi:MAG: 50S ribosomal protein L30 [Actinobacteria bacterium]|nr:MAG: 50S ribosomal protein L30 [Actinomycetota bacterium]REK39997.1 MAG: 50S ribosomal protein L30 [Actinomycetota bacterium]
MAKAKKVTVTLRRSLIGEKPKTRATVEALGLRKIRQSATHEDNASLRGMIDKVRHLVDVEEA